LVGHKPFWLFDKWEPAATVELPDQQPLEN
jgi:hypothetical protein